MNANNLSVTNKLILCLIPFMGFASLFLFYYFIQNYELSKIYPLMNVSKIVLIILVSTFLFKESITINKTIGLIFVIIGIYLIENNNKIESNKLTIK